MGAVPLLRNQFLNIIDPENSEWEGASGLRLVHKEGDSWFVVPIPIGTSMPTEIAEGDLTDMIERAEVLPSAEDPFERLLAELAKSEKAVAEQEKRWAVLGSVLTQDSPSFLRRRTRGPLIRALSEDTGISRDSLLRWIRLYWERGLTPRALLPDHRRKGGAGKRRTPGETKRGRPSLLRAVDGKPRGINVTRQVRRLIEKGVVEFVEEQGQSFPQAHESTLGKYFSDRVYHRGGEQVRARENRPTLGQFLYWGEQHLEKRGTKSVEKRMGSKNYQKDGRPLLSSLRASIDYPGERFEIDATDADVHLVSESDRRQAIGRAVLYVVRDIFSGMIVGFYVGLENASWEGMRLALWNTFEPKEGICSRLGIRFNPEEWPSSGVCDLLVGDRGELVSKNADHLTNELYIQVLNLPGYRPDLKPFVEAIFKTINELGVGRFPGKAEKRTRGKRDPREKACLTLKEFERAVVLTILQYNRTYRPKKLENIPPNYPVHERGSPTPVELWNWGVQNVSGAPRMVSQETLRRALWIREKATVSQRGIRVKKLTYTPSVLVGPDAYGDHPLALWFTRRNSNRPKRVEVLRNPRDVGEIYFDTTGTGVWEHAVLREELAHYSGWSLREVQKIEELRRIHDERHASGDLDLKLTLAAQRDDIVAEAKAAQEEGAPGVKRTKTTNTRAARDQERSRMERSTPVASREPTTSDDEDTEAPTPDIEEYIAPPSYLDILD